MAAAQMEEVARPFLKFFQSTAEVLVRLIQWIVWYVVVVLTKCNRVHLRS